MPILNPGRNVPEWNHLHNRSPFIGKRAEQRRNLRDNTRYDRKVAKLTQLRPNGFGN